MKREDDDIFGISKQMETLVTEGAREAHENDSSVVTALPVLSQKALNPGKRKRGTNQQQDAPPNKVDERTKDVIQSIRKRAKKTKEKESRTIIMDDTATGMPPDTVEKFELPLDSIAHVMAVKERAENALHARDAIDIGIYTGLPTEQQEIDYLKSMSERMFADYVETEQVNVPDCAIVSLSHVERFMCEPLEGVHRPCINGKDCFMVHTRGFPFREFLCPADYRVLMEMGETVANADALFTLQYPCVVCELVDLGCEWLIALRKKNGRTPVQMESGHVEEMHAKYRLRNRFHVYTDLVGEYRRGMCIGAECGFYGYVPSFNYKDYPVRTRDVDNPVTHQVVRQRYLIHPDKMVF